jgi:PHP family Zn ribbon phosphoesterase
MLKPCFADLHVHTVLSPCGEVEMIPPLIIQQARRIGLSIIAVTDHNSAENAGAVMEAAEGSGVTVLPGMEVQTREEVHLVCLFDGLEQAYGWQETVYSHLPDEENPEDVFGPQFVVDATGGFIRHNKRLLLTSTSLSVEQVVEGVTREGGLCIAAHVDRPSFSLLSVLGFIPPGLELAAVEISTRLSPDEAYRSFPQLAGRPIIVSGDAHHLSELVARTILVVEQPCLAELRRALEGRHGRSLRVLGRTYRS